MSLFVRDMLTVKEFFCHATERHYPISASEPGSCPPAIAELITATALPQKYTKITLSAAVNIFWTTSPHSVSEGCSL